MAAHREDLREFLRSRRKGLNPGDVGLPAGPARRSAGLRREEIAALAGVSADNYALLEQGRTHNVSSGTLNSVAKALQLTDAERRQLFDLSHASTARRAAEPRRQRVRSSVVTMLDTLVLQPAFVVGHRLDVLACNWLASEIMGDLLGRPNAGRNLARFVLLDVQSREVYPDWDAVAADTVAMLRFYADRHRDDAQLASLVDELAAASPEFTRLWKSTDVRDRAWGTTEFRHPIVGEVTLESEALDFPGDHEQRLVIYTAEPGSSSADSLRMLASVRPPDATTAR